MNFPFRVISGESIHKLLDGRVEDCIRIVSDAYLAHSDKQSVNPNSQFLLFPEKPSSRIIALPAFLGGETKVSGIKWIASYPENVIKGFPRASAVLILNDYDTGYPFACMESSIISAARTAASAVLAAQHLNGGRRRVSSVAFIGNGVIAKYIYRFFLGARWEFDNVLLYDRHPNESERFKQSICGARHGVESTIAPDVESAIRSAEIVVFATTAGTPHVHDLGLFEHNPLVLHVSLRDLAPEMLLESQNIVDDVEHVMQANTSCHLAEKITGSRAFVRGTIAEVIKGEKTTDRSKPVVFSPFGMGILDLAVGKWLHDLAVETAEFQYINNFFYELDR